MTTPDKKTQIFRISEYFFCYMAKSYPVMCMSDEFYFFPRAIESVRFLDCLDGMDKEKIEQDISYTKNLKASLEGIGLKDLDLETQIDLVLLSQSISTYLREFEEVKIWQTDPNLYLKVLLLGVEQVLSRPSFMKADVDETITARVTQIPRLLNEAKQNLKKIPDAYLEVAIETTEAAIDYFRTATLPLTGKTLQSLVDFKIFLKKKASHIPSIRKRELLESILKDSFSYNRSLEEIFEIASEEYCKTLKELSQIARKVRPENNWQQILSTHRIEIRDSKELLRLYSNQIERIKDFFKEKDVITIPDTQEIVVRLTPKFMRPLRASASYSSPVTADMRESAYFYITDGLFSNVHNEYIFVTAHETYPGHHLLDWMRRQITNPIRQQVESPLFYEGWASYAERLIDELGYITDPVQRLLGLRRQAWRAVRAMLDVGIRINRLKIEDARGALEGLGYTAKTVRLMLRHYLLLPGYQLCYTIGKFEIDRLKEGFSSRLGIKKFHNFLLEGGQIPFGLIEKRMQKQLCRKSS